MNKDAFYEVLCAKLGLDPDQVGHDSLTAEWTDNGPVRITWSGFAMLSREEMLEVFKKADEVDQ